LSLGQSDFAALRGEERVYVDKSAYFAKLRRFGWTLSLARPDGFGKSLLMSALDAYFSGEKGLFRGLAAARTLDDPDFQPFSVLNFDLSLKGGARRRSLPKRLLELVQSCAARHGARLREKSFAPAVVELAEKVARRGGREIVILVDSYDEPMTRALARGLRRGDEEAAWRAQETLREFFGALRRVEALTAFRMVAGTTSSAWLEDSADFEACDVSAEEEFAGLCGFDSQEIRRYFAPHLKDASREMKIGSRELVALVERRYGGFAFDGKKRVARPLSVLKFLRRKKCGDFWKERTRDGLIRGFFAKNARPVDFFHGESVEGRFARRPTDILLADPLGFLYQTGFLTLRARPEGAFVLQYPNLEVYARVSALFLEKARGRAESETRADARALREALAQGDVAALGDLLRAFFAELAESPFAQALIKFDRERFHHFCVKAFLAEAGFPARRGDHFERDGWDFVIAFPEVATAIKIFVAREGEDWETLARSGFKGSPNLGELEGTARRALFYAREGRVALDARATLPGGAREAEEGEEDGQLA
jgi:hypothetical protein